MNRIANTSSTRKTIENARKSFESATGVKVKNATLNDIETWLGTLRGMGRATSTCRTYLSLLKQLTGLSTEMPPRERVDIRVLSADEAGKMMSAAKPRFYALVACLLTAGPEILKYTWRDVAALESPLPVEVKMVLINEARRRGHDTSALFTFGVPGHFLNGPDMDEIVFPQIPHDINRQLKSIARKAGIGDKGINITAMKNAHRNKIVPLSLLVSDAPQEKPVRRSARMHGIGRRSAFMVRA